MRATARKRSAVSLAIDVSAGSPAPATLSPGSITTTMVAEASEYNLRQLMAFAKWLRVDTTKVRLEDQKLVDRVMATIGGDGAGFEQALKYPPVNQLFARGVLYFAR